MRWFAVPRLSASMVVALAALVVACAGTALATGGLVSGDKLIKPASLSGNRLRKHTITGKQLDLSRVGKVPRAASADTATEAIAAATATTAAKVGKVSYRNAAFTVAANSRATAHANCDGGTVAVGGGSTSPSEGGQFTDFLVDSYPSNDRTAWQVTVENENPGTTIVETVWVVCVSASSTG